MTSKESELTNVKHRLSKRAMHPTKSNKQITYRPEAETMLNRKRLHEHNELDGCRYCKMVSFSNANP
jgi:hypothetical protein